MSGKRILVLAETPIKRDARVSRQLGFLTEGGYEVECACLEAGSVAGVEYHTFGTDSRPRAAKALGALMLLFGMHEAYWHRKPFVRAVLAKLGGRSFDAIIANDADMVPLALKLAAGRPCKVVFDAHEYAPAQYAHSLRWRILFGRYMHWLVARFAAKADAMFTVGEGIARLYKERYGLVARVLTNAPRFEVDLRPTPLAEGRVRLVHHGSINRNRKIELMIAAMDLLPEGYTLDLMIVNNYGPYYEYLRSVAGEKVRFIDPVAVETVARSINGYDVGVYLLPPSNLNQELALPNKFFEFVQARLAIVVGPSPEMAAYVKDLGLGAAADDYSPEAFAKAIQSLSREAIMAGKQAAASAAERLSAAGNGRILRETLAEVLA